MSERQPSHTSNIELHRVHRDIIMQTHNILDWQSYGQGRDANVLRYADWESETTGLHLRLEQRPDKLAPFKLSAIPDSLHRSQSAIDYQYGSADLYATKLTGTTRVSGGVAAREIRDHLQTFPTLSASERSDFDEFAAYEVALSMKGTAFVVRALTSSPRLRQRYVKSAVATRAERENVNPLLVQHYLLMQTWQ